MNQIPSAMLNIDKFLDENKMRLVDLFKTIDKDKDWFVIKEDFIREFHAGNLDIKRKNVEELINNLSDEKNPNQINYKKLANSRKNLIDYQRRNKRGIFK
jgi:Ca2+-binding EF-hand superfamily protein